MIEAIMFSALGFLAASLVALVLLSAVWHRAVRLTTRRIEGAIPVSMAEIQADKDQLRAEFAMSTRRLETSVEQLKLKTTEQLAEIGRKSETIRLLKTEIEEKTAGVTALEGQEKTVREKLRSTEEELSVKSRSLQEAESELANKSRELAQMTHAFNDKTSEADSRSVQVVALETQCEALKGRVSDLEREVSATEERLVHERSQVEVTTRALVEERERAHELARRVSEMESLLGESKMYTEGLDRTVSSLEAEAHRQAELAGERERALVAAQSEAERSRAEMLAVHRDVDHSSRSYSSTIEALQAENSKLEHAYAQLFAERDRLQQEVASFTHQTESAWSNERVENALLRERINDVAAEVARLTVNLEGTGSPIERIMAETSPPPVRHQQNGAPRRPAGGGAPDPRGAAEHAPSLAERIRALQARSRR